MIQCLDAFLSEHYKSGFSVLLGYSGGPDSSALLHGFWKLKSKYGFELIVIHVDHGWRNESASEAEGLKKYVRGLGLPFVLETIDKPTNGANLEEKARMARMKIFLRHKEVYNAQAVALAHQAQDQSETVLKRLFEGSGITSLGAMREVSLYEGMSLWRPLLKLPKKELLDYCKENRIEYLNDKTNGDPRFLRSRMRRDLIPLLEQHFGKQIQGNLARFSETVHELTDYLVEKVQCSGDLRKMHPFEAKLVVKRLAEKNSLKLGKLHIDQIYKLLIQRDSVSRKFIFGEKTLVICNGSINLN